MEKQCVTEEILLDYLEGNFTPKKKEKVENHLADCDHCRELLVLTKNILNENALADMEPVPDHVTQKATDTILSLRKDSVLQNSIGFLKNKGKIIMDGFTNALPGEHSPVLAVRSGKPFVGEKLILLRRTFQDVDAFIEIEIRSPDKANIKISIEKGTPLTEPLRITLLQNDREIASYLDDVVRFENVQVGFYMLRVTRFDETEPRHVEIPFEIRE